MILGKENYIKQGVLNSILKYTRSILRAVSLLVKPRALELELKAQIQLKVPVATNEKVIKSFCVNCLECEKWCPTNAIDFSNPKKPTLKVTQCIYCDKCLDICPKEIIQYQEISLQDQKSFTISFLQKENSSQ